MYHLEYHDLLLLTPALASSPILPPTTSATPLSKFPRDISSVLHHTLLFTMQTSAPSVTLSSAWKPWLVRFLSRLVLPARPCPMNISFAHVKVCIPSRTVSLYARTTSPATSSGTSTPSTFTVDAALLRPSLRYNTPRRKSTANGVLYNTTVVVANDEEGWEGGTIGGGGGGGVGLVH